MTKETIQIDLPPPPKLRQPKPSRGTSALWASLALVVGLGCGFFAGWKVSREIDSNNASSTENVASTPVNSGEIDQLIHEAKTSITAGNWTGGRDLLQQVLNSDPANFLALELLPLVDTHLDGARGGLKVVTVPAGATVKVGNQFSGKSPVEFDKLPLGEYQIQISMEGCQPLIRTVTISEDQIFELSDVTLARSAGSLMVVSEPKGAEFKVIRNSPTGEPLMDLIKAGTTPANLKELEAGDYSVLVQMPGWPEYTERVRVEHNRDSSVSAVFTKKALSVTSDPSGAEVWVRLEGQSNFEKRGETPTAVNDLPNGLHQIEVKYQDWVPIRRTIKILPEVIPEPIDIEWQRGMVRLASDPPGAEVYHFNKRLGGPGDVTPFTVELPEGEYKLTAIHEKLDSKEASVVVNGDEGSVVDTEFKFDYGSILIETEPTGAAIVLNGEPFGRTPRKMEVVKPGSYTFTLNKEGFSSGKVSGEVENGGFLQFNTRLKYDPTPKKNSGFTNSFKDELVWVASLGGWVGVHEVTQRTYQAVMSENPSTFKSDTRPVDSVSWYDADKFCKKLTISEASRDALPHGYVYKLPTDQQWTLFAGAADLSQAITSLDIRREGTEPVGQLQPNEFGIYDIRGNVWEWCQDWYSPVIMNRARDAGASATDSWVGSDRKVLRGGSWNRSTKGDFNLGYRLGVRQGDEGRYDVGFRVVLMPE